MIRAGTARALSLMLTVFLVLSMFSGAVCAGEPEDEGLLTDYGTFLSALKVLRGERVALTYSGRDVWQGFEGMDL